MASSLYETLFQCVACDSQLSKLSKCLPCLHGVCETCFHNTLDEAKEICKCPKCDEEFEEWKSFGVSPILSQELLRQELDSSSEFQCGWCLEDGISSVAKHWCGECSKLLCNHCIRYHKRFIKKEHLFTDVEGMERSAAVAMMMEMPTRCSSHHQELQLYCEGCDQCYCESCCTAHPHESMTPDLCRIVTPLRLREEVTKGREQVPIREQELSAFEERVKASNEELRRFVSDLKSDCGQQLDQLWSEYDIILAMVKESALRLCEQINDGMAEQLKKLNAKLHENDRILNEITNWRLNRERLWHDRRFQDVDVFRGMQMLDKRFPLIRHSVPTSEGKRELSVTFPDYWRKALDTLENEDGGSVSFFSITCENRFDLPESKNDDADDDDDDGGDGGDGDFDVDDVDVDDVDDFLLPLFLHYPIG